MPANANTDRSSNLKFKTFILLIASFFFLAVPPAGSQTVWMKYTGNPIMDVGPGTWESKAAAVTCVSLEDTLYKMWYFGQQGNIRRLGYATSTDGTTWTKYPNNSLPDVGLPRSLAQVCITALTVA